MKNANRDINQFIEAVVFVPSSLADAVTNYVTDNIARGVELKDSDNSQMVGIKFYVPASAKQDFRPAFREYLSQITSKEMPEAPRILENFIVSRDWEDTYRESIKPVIIDEVICIRPPWDEAPVGVEIDIIIEPKMAFGTGHHETTRTCLKLIYKHFKKSQRLLDFGCGSGVLAILADKLGAAYVKAVDCDKLAIDNCLENFKINQVKCQYDIQLGSFNRIDNDAPCDMICANLTKPDIIANLSHLVRVLRPGGLLIFSGLLDSEQNEIENYFKNNNLTIWDVIHENEWLTYSLKK